VAISSSPRLVSGAEFTSGSAMLHAGPQARRIARFGLRLPRSHRHD
jgi:hypothetical protein